MSVCVREWMSVVSGGGESTETNEKSNFIKSMYYHFPHFFLHISLIKQAHIYTTYIALLCLECEIKGREKAKAKE